MLVKGSLTESSCGCMSSTQQNALHSLKTASHDDMRRQQSRFESATRSPQRDARASLVHYGLCIRSNELVAFRRDFFVRDCVLFDGSPQLEVDQKSLNWLQKYLVPPYAQMSAEMSAVVSMHCMWWPWHPCLPSQSWCRVLARNMDCDAEVA